MRSTRCHYHHTPAALHYQYSPRFISLRDPPHRPSHQFHSVRSPPFITPRNLLHPSHSVHLPSSPPETFTPIPLRSPSFITPRNLLHPSHSVHLPSSPPETFFTPIPLRSSPFITPRNLLHPSHSAHLPSSPPETFFTHPTPFMYLLTIVCQLSCKMYTVRLTHLTFQ